MQNRKGRRGFNFTVRVTVEERLALEKARRRQPGPRSLGAFLVWRALSRTGSAAEAIAPAMPPPAMALPELGHCPLKPAMPRRPGTAPPRRILDLCAGSGAWSEPYEKAGYDVIRVSLPALDVRTFEPPPGVHGVLGAPPCDQFSLARNGHKSPRDFERGLECVAACLRIIALCRPKWWALENPVGHLSRFLGTPRDVFEPCDFGDPWTKRTALWGDFVQPERGPFVKALGGGPLCLVCDPEARKTSWCSNPAHRAVTPPGFARAFFLANP